MIASPDPTQLNWIVIVCCGHSADQLSSVELGRMMWSLKKLDKKVASLLSVVRY